MGKLLSKNTEINDEIHSEASEESAAHKDNKRRKDFDGKEKSEATSRGGLQSRTRNLFRSSASSAKKVSSSTEDRKTQSELLELEISEKYKTEKKVEKVRMEGDVDMTTFIEDGQDGVGSSSHANKKKSTFPDGNNLPEQEIRKEDYAGYEMNDKRSKERPQKKTAERTNILPVERGLSETESTLLEERFKETEIPVNWISVYNCGERAIFRGDDTNGYSKRNGWFRTKFLPQDYFRETAYHCYKSAMHCLYSMDYHEALRELAEAKTAHQNFVGMMQKQEAAGYNRMEAQRGDEEVDKMLKMVIYSSFAYISFKMGNYEDMRRLTQNAGTRSASDSAKAAILGIKASVLSHCETAIEDALNIAQEITSLDPYYWRWHDLVFGLMRLLPEPQDYSERRELKEDMFTAVETVWHLESTDPNRALILGDAYADAAFQLSRKKQYEEEREGYAKRAMNAYMNAIERAPNCPLTSARVAQCLWRIRGENEMAAKKALYAADKGMSVLLTDDSYAEESEMEKKVETTLLLGSFWLGAGKMDTALYLLNLASSTPTKNIYLSFRSDLQLIVCHYQRENSQKSKNMESKVNILSMLDKFVEKFKETPFEAHSLCHRGQYLMDVKKDRAAALESFYKAVCINPRAQFLKAFFPRFSRHQRPLRIPDLVHELACEQLRPLVVRAKRGSPEAMKRSDFLEKCIDLAKSLENLTLTSVKNKEQIQEGSVEDLKPETKVLEQEGNIVDQKNICDANLLQTCNLSADSCKPNLNSETSLHEKQAQEDESSSLFLTETI